MELNNILVQAIGFLGFGLIGLSYLAKRKERILLWSIIGGLIVALHFYLLDGLTGALCNIIGGVMLIIIYIYDRCGKKNKLPLILLMIPTAIAIAWFSWAGPESLLPIIAAITILVAFISSNEKYIRIANIIGGSLWIIYGLIMGSVSSVICEAFIILMTAIALYKYRSKGKKKAKSRKRKSRKNII